MKQKKSKSMKKKMMRNFLRFSNMTMTHPHESLSLDSLLNAGISTDTQNHTS